MNEETEKSVSNKDTPKVIKSDHLKVSDLKVIRAESIKVNSTISPDGVTVTINKPKSKRKSLKFVNLWKIERKRKIN